MMAEHDGATESIAHPLAAAPAPPSAFSGLNALGDGPEIEAAAGPYLGYLSELADELGLIDPVEVYFRPLIGQWEVLGAEAEGLRRAAKAAGVVSGQLADDLGRLDAGWSGDDADAFVAYMGAIGVAGADVGDALSTLAGALDELVSAVRRIVVDLAEVLVDTAGLVSESAMLPVGGATRTRTQMHEAQQTAKALYEAARDVLEAFGRLCDGVDDPDVASRSIEIAHRYPQERFKLHDAGADAGPAADSQAGGGAAEGTTTPSAAHDSAEGRHTGARDAEIEQGQSTGAGALPLGPAPAVPSASQQPGSSMGMPMVPMGLGGMGMGGGAKQRQSKHRPAPKASDVFGEPAQVVPPVIGEDESKPAPKPPPRK
ncbi:WXG100 family type VII secretion target [Amycolatopsis sp. NPDC059021]|uniref:WXG100 family type VII secretion target n=1 Tax=Amycolatopsis sp. NPDC059021 TaxID=3346704 RepID=UPI00366E477A